MSWDNRRLKCISMANICVIDINIDRKCCRRNPHNSIIIPLYLTILHLCLFVNVEALPTDGREAPLMILPSESYKSDDFSINDGSNPHSSFRLVKRLASAQSDSVPVDAGAQKKNGTDINSEGLKATASTTSSPILKESSDPSVQNSKKTELGVKNETLVSQTDTDTTKDSEEGELGHGPPNGMKPEAVLRLFYVFVGVGVIVLIYILIKFLRCRRKRATMKYRVLAHSDEQEMFPLAADDGDDEEIFNAADHHTLK